jgi:hypothetical protein
MPLIIKIGVPGRFLSGLLTVEGFKKSDNNI